jgi:hypothetical protein
MPPATKVSSLVAPEAHLSSVSAGAADSDVLADGLVLDDVLVLSLALPPELESPPQATRDSPRAAPTATVADSRLYRLVAMVDRFTS